MKRTIVIGDIHGCYDEFIELINKIGVTEDDLILSVGDIVDRGPKSLELYHYFKNTPNAKMLMGNHERKHLRNVLSYSQEIVKIQMGEEYPKFIKWLKNINYYHETEEALIVHAGFEKDVPLEKQREDVLAGTTSGEKYLQEVYGEGHYWTEFYDGEKPIIFGHHVVGDEVEIYKKAYGIDTGACHGGYLTAIELPGFKIHQVKGKDYWEEQAKRYQIPVLDAKPWDNTDIPKIKRDIKKLSYNQPDEVMTYLNNLADWIKALDNLLPSLKEAIDTQAKQLLAEHGDEGFNPIAAKYPTLPFYLKVKKVNYWKVILRVAPIPLKREYA